MNEMNIKIDKDVPIFDHRAGNGNSRIYPLGELREIGDSFFCPVPRAKLSAAAQVFRRVGGKHETYRHACRAVTANDIPGTRV